MSSIFSISSVTDAGIAAMQEALDHGYTMTFTSMKTGNGIYTIDEDVSGRTALKSLKNTYAVGSIEEDTDGATISAVFTNYDGENILVAEDYKINEIGIFCTVNSIEYLYAIAAVPNDDGMEMPAYDIVAQNLTQFVQEWYIANSDHANITVDSTGALIPVTDIVNNLTSTATTKPLSANMGRELEDTKAETVKAVYVGLTTTTAIDEGAIVFYDNKFYTVIKTGGLPASYTIVPSTDLEDANIPENYVVTVEGMPATGIINAYEINYNNVGTSLTATDVQGAITALDSNSVKVKTNLYTVPVGSTLDATIQMYVGSVSIEDDIPSGTILATIPSVRYFSGSYMSGAGVTCGAFNNRVYAGTLKAGVSPSIKVTWLYQ